MNFKVTVAARVESKAREWGMSLSLLARVIDELLADVERKDSLELGATIRAPVPCIRITKTKFDEVTGHVFRINFWVTEDKDLRTRCVFDTTARTVAIQDESDGD